MKITKRVVTITLSDADDLKRVTINTECDPPILGAGKNEGVSPAVDLAFNFLKTVGAAYSHRMG